MRSTECRSSHHCVCYCVQGQELTAHDLARAKDHVECAVALQQHAGKSAAECRTTDKVRDEAPWVVQQAHDAAAREAQYWITDMLQLHRVAAELVVTIINSATALLARLHTADNHNDDQQRPRMVYVIQLCATTGVQTVLSLTAYM